MKILTYRLLVGSVFFILGFTQAAEFKPGKAYPTQHSREVDSSLSAFINQRGYVTDWSLVVLVRGEGHYILNQKGNRALASEPVQPGDWVLLDETATSFLGWRRANPTAEVKVFWNAHPPSQNQALHYTPVVEERSDSNLPEAVKASSESVSMDVAVNAVPFVASPAPKTKSAAELPDEETLIPNALSPELEALPSIDLKRGWVDTEPLSPEVKQAVKNQDLAKLSAMLATTDARVQRQAALGMGQLTEHQTEAREILSRFIAAEMNPGRTEFGEQFFARQTALNAAEQSLAALLPKAETAEHSEKVSTDLKTASSVTQPLEKQPAVMSEEGASTKLWPVIAGVSAAALGLVWLLMKKRKV